MFAQHCLYHKIEKKQTPKTFLLLLFLRVLRILCILPILCIVFLQIFVTLLFIVIRENFTKVESTGLSFQGGVNLETFVVIYPSDAIKKYQMISLLLLGST